MAGLRTEQEVRDALARRMQHGFAEHVAGVREDWPYTLALGRPTKQQILEGFVAIGALTRTLKVWERTLGVEVEYQTREAGGPQRVPARMTVPSIDAAARLATPREHETWTQVVERTKVRESELVARFSGTGASVRARVLRALDAADDLEFELLLAAGEWFGTHDATGLTSREVPLPGIDGKWLGNARRRSLVCLLAGKDELGLTTMPASLEFAYLDPEHLARGGRRYDSWVAGDVQAPAYAPSVVVIVENKETYLKFPALAEGICVFGSGWAGHALVRQLEWVAAAPKVLYWGDIDADGFEILDAYRRSGIACASVLMDADALRVYSRFGTNLEKDHRTRIVRERKELAYLNDDERAAYDLLTSDTYAGNRRVEQERIPLSDALDTCKRIL